MTRAPIGAQVSHEKLSTPDRSVRAVARSVKRNAYDRTGKSVFRHACRDMCMMVLNCNPFRKVRSQCVTGGNVVRMHIVCNYLRGHVQLLTETFCFQREREVILVAREIGEDSRHVCL